MNDVINTNYTFYRGRVALYSILKVLGVKKHDHVALQAFTCLAVPEAIMAAGAIPQYIDIDDNLCMSPEDLKKKITGKTKAIIIQHTYGIPADMDDLLEIALQKNIPVIEDCCHTYLSMYKQKRVGSFGIAGFYSFEWGKPIVAGIGGGLNINSNDLESEIQTLYKKFDRPGFINQIRMEIQYAVFKFLYRPKFYWPLKRLFHLLSSFGIAEGNYNPIDTIDEKADKDFLLRMGHQQKNRMIKKLKNLTKTSEHSKRISNEYSSKIKSDKVSHLKFSLNKETVFVRYPLIAKNKNKLLDEAQKANIELAEWYTTPIHPLKDEELRKVHYISTSCPNAEKYAQRIVTLPTHGSVGNRDVSRIINFFNN